MRALCTVMNRVRRLATGCALCFVAATFAERSNGTDFNVAASWHKIQVNDPALAAQITAAGGHLISDYGGYQLYAAPQISSELQSHPAVEMRDEYNSILLNAGALDTSVPETQALRKSRVEFMGRRLHLVQFAGPVQPAWFEELVKVANSASDSLGAPVQRSGPNVRGQELCPRVQDFTYRSGLDDASSDPRYRRDSIPDGSGRHGPATIL
jgi:hypothetical protein